MSIVVTIPDSVAQSLRLPEPEVERRLRRELAVALYAQAILPLGKAAELAGMGRIAFGELIGERGIPRQYSQEDLDADVAYARGE
ncbi:MAG: UPF0175 family protein [Bryobacteraceae bacterium]